MHAVKSAAQAHVSEGSADVKPAPVSLVQLQAQSVASRCLADALGVHRCSDEAFARACGVSRAEVQRWTDAACERTITVKRLIAASHTRSRVVLSYLAALRSHMDHEVQAPSRVEHTSALLDLVAEVGELARSTREALSDGVLTDAERIELLRGAERAQATLTGLVRDLQVVR